MLDNEVLNILREEFPHNDPLVLLRAAEQMANGEDPDLLTKYKNIPLGIEKFLDETYFVGKRMNLYPEVRKELIELNSGKYVEAVLTGSIGAAKTTVALYTLFYQLYLLSCLRNPHEEFDLDPTSEIVFVFQSINAKTAKEVGYNRFKAMVSSSPYFTTEFMFRKDLESKLVFPGRIEVVPVSGEETAAIGENVVGGLIDELNYMAVVKDSKVSIDGGVYDQAVAIYNSIARRRKSRFLSKGRVAGMLCLVSSKRYPGQFTDIKQAEAENDPTIFVYDKRTWEVVPPDRFSGVWFQVFVGDSTRSPRILVEGEEVPEEDTPLVRDVPIEYKIDFENDIMNALRDILGVSTIARHPFIYHVESIAQAFERGHPSILSRETVDFKKTQLQIYTKNFRKKHLPRWVHIDLGLTGDCAGVSCGFVSGFKGMTRSIATVEYMPLIDFDFVLEVKPPKGGEILFHKIRSLVYKLMELGLNIRWASLDSYQSADTIQLFRQKGILAGIKSIDTTIDPYMFYKSALYDGRLALPVHTKLSKELKALEKIVDKNKEKVNHPPNGSKDVSDSGAGVVHGLTLRREIWVNHKISITQMPAYVLTEKDKLSD